VGPLVLDTEVASLRFKDELPISMYARLAGRQPLITFVTLAEMTKWADWRGWGTARRRRLTRWLGGMAVLPGTEEVAVVCGQITASALRRHRPRPVNDTWIAACCLAYELPLATRNVKDFEDFATYDGLSLVTE
jgi:toxin FitB